MWVGLRVQLGGPVRNRDGTVGNDAAHSADRASINGVKTRFRGRGVLERVFTQSVMRGYVDGMGMRMNERDIHSDSQRKLVTPRG